MRTVPRIIKIAADQFLNSDVPSSSTLTTSGPLVYVAGLVITSSLLLTKLAVVTNFHNRKAWKSILTVKPITDSNAFPSELPSYKWLV